MSFTPFARAVSITRGSTCPRMIPVESIVKTCGATIAIWSACREEGLDALLAAQIPESFEPLGAGVGAGQPDTASAARWTARVGGGIAPHEGSDARSSAISCLDPRWAIIPDNVTISSFSSESRAPRSLVRAWASNAPTRPATSQPGRLPDSFYAGGADCGSAPRVPRARYNPDFFILRQAACTNFEKPFLDLVFGRDAALLLDTGAGHVDVAGP